MKHYKLFINNEWVDSEDKKTFISYSKADGKEVNEFSSASKNDVDRACQAARAAFPAWSSLDADERAEYLLKLAAVVKKYEREMAEAEALETGKPIRDSLGFDVRVSIWAFEYFANLAREVKGDVIPLVKGGDCEPGDLAFVTYEPYGVVATIAPYNFPIHLMTRCLAPALAAGNTCVLKASSMTPTSVAMLGDIALEANLPPGVINIVHGGGSTVGDWLVGNREVDVIGFTGSESVGRNIMKISASSDVIKKCILELGGKGPVIVEPDADLEIATDSQISGFTFNQGEVCCAMTRVILHEDIYDEYLGMLKGKLERIKIGHPLDESTEMGSLISEDHLKSVDRFVREAVQNGATLYYGGKRYEADDLEPGPYYMPTILTDVKEDMQVWCDEVFGPVLSVVKYKSTEEAIAMANDTDFGLGANIFTEDYKKAFAMSKRINAGLVWVNMGNGMHMAVPFGGNKNSGMGREYGTYGLHEYLKLKSNIWKMT